MNETSIYDHVINCGAMGKGDDSCPGCIYWSAEGKLLCNECGIEYELVEIKKENLKNIFGPRLKEPEMQKMYEYIVGMFIVTWILLMLIAAFLLGK